MYGKRWRSFLCVLMAAVIVSVGSFSSSAAYTGKVYMFTYDVNSLPSYFSGFGISTRADASRSMPWLWKMNYDAGEYLNNSVEPIYSVLSGASIVTISSHGDSGYVLCPDPHSSLAPRYTMLTGNSYSGAMFHYRSLSSAPSLSKVKLMIFASCNSSFRDPNYGSLGASARSRGATTTMGWMASIPNDLTSAWLEYFFQACYFNKATVNSAAATATQRLRNEHPNNQGVDALAIYATGNGDTYIYS